MKSIEDEISLSDINKILNGDNAELLYTEKVLIADAHNWPITLKVEIVNWGNYGLNVKTISQSYVNSVFDTLIAEGTEAKYLYYLKVNGNDTHEYIYDTNGNMVYKIEKTKIWQYTVHSIEELMLLKGEGTFDTLRRYNIYTNVVQNVEIVEISNQKYYEPDLNGTGAEVTQLIFYKMQDDAVTITEYPMYVSEWLDKGKPNKITVGDDTYILYDYANKIWANIRIKSSGITTNWTWIPRYSYSLDGNITNTVFVDTSNTLLIEQTGEFTIAPSFAENTLKGIWVGKYEPTNLMEEEIAKNKVAIPDLTGLDASKTYLELYNADGTAFTGQVLLSTVQSDMATFVSENNWYDYANKKWANIKIVSNGIETWWVWIPRFAYRQETGDTVLISGNTAPVGYTIAPSFEGNELAGIWVGKYEPTEIEEEEEK